jgi:hypothetical protein
MPLFTPLTVTTRNGRVDRHPLPCFCDARKLMPQDQRFIQACISNTALAEPVQVRAAHPDRFYVDQFLSLASDRDRLIMNL